MTMMFAQSVHWGLALVPVLILLIIFIWLDTFKLMSLREILILLAIGGVAAVLAWPLSGRLLDTLPIGFSFYSRFVAPWIEEAIKAGMIILLFRLNRIGYKLDAVISGFAIGAGFSVVENIVYLLRFPDYGAGTWLVRGLGTAVMHGTTLAILAAIAHELAERETREAAGDFDFHLWWFLPGYLAAVALHMTFNQFPERPLLAGAGRDRHCAPRNHRHFQFRNRRSRAMADCGMRRAPHPTRRTSLRQVARQPSRSMNGCACVTPRR